MPSSPPRSLSLDGLRGLAAAVVVVHHSLLTDGRLFAAVADPTLQFAVGSPLWWWTYTPAHLLWAGTEAVYVFFVLSGVVLTFGAGRPAFRWASYYPQRLARLYLPVWAAIVFAIATILLVPRSHDPGLSLWITERAAQYRRHELVLDSTLVLGHSGIVSPLWSLRWEMWFSLLLPVYLLLRRRGRWPTVAIGLGLLTLIAVGGQTDRPALTYLPMFGLGVLLADGWEAVRAATRAWSRATWGLVLVAAVLCLLCGWLLPDVLGRRPGWAPALGAVGAVVLVTGFGMCPALVRVAEARVVHWLGRISFSLYLVHDPVVVGMRYLAPHGSPWLLVVPMICVSVLVGWLFYAAVERPLHRFARRLGRARVGGRHRRPGGPRRASVPGRRSGSSPSIGGREGGGGERPHERRSTDV